MLKKSNKTIVVNNINKNKGILTFYENGIKEIETAAFIGKNGLTKNKVEGDGKTPIGRYELGLCFGIHKKEKILVKNYIQINENSHWVDDVKSKYYNQMVDITKVNKDWRSAEHLIEYPKQYEYAIEIKANKDNIPGKGSAIFLHCSDGKPTSGCIAIERNKMREIINLIQEGMEIFILE